MVIDGNGTLGIAEALQQPVWTVRPDGSVDYANAYWQAYTGLTGAAALGDGWAAAVHPDDLEPIRATWRRAAESGSAYEVEYRFRRADGVFRWHLARVTPVRDAAGTHAGWVASAVDIDDRHQDADALRVSEARYRDLVDNARDIIYSLTLEGVVLTVNPAVEQVLGYRPDEVIGRSIDDIIVPERIAYTHLMLDRKLAGESQSEYELEAFAADGRRVVLEVRTRLATADGQPTIIHGIARDITIRRDRARQAELGAAIGAALTARLPLDEQLQRCAETLVAHLDAALARIWIVDDEDPVALVMCASAGMYTSLDGPYARTPIGQMRIGRIAAEQRPHLTNDVDTDASFHAKAWARREGIVAFAGYPLLVGERILGVVALFARTPLEVTTLTVLGSVVDGIAVGIDRARAELAFTSLLERERHARAWAQAAEDRYRGVFEGVADTIIIADGDGKVLDANAATLALLGYDRAEMLQRRWQELVPASSAWNDAVAAQLRDEGRWQGEVDMFRKDGTLIPVEARATVVDLPDGAVIISALRDISERRRFERLQRDFLAMVTHDLRSPLTAIKGRAQLLRRRAPDDGRIDSAMGSILDQVEQMGRLIDGLADLVRVDAGQLRLRPERFDLVALAREQAAIVQEQTTRHVLQVPDGQGPIVGLWDRQRLGQVMQNLLTNAVKYSPDGGDIAVRVEASRGEARVLVEDHGVGIDRDHLTRLFERFYRADATGAGGLGLGLHISQMLVEAHGGRILVASTPGEGSTFTVVLPLSVEM
jgi:PAS domain S-box-containing protein